MVDEGSTGTDSALLVDNLQIIPPDGPVAAGSYRVEVIGPTQIISGRNFGNRLDVPAEVSGVKFYDLDADGVQENGEYGLVGWTIFADLNNNGRLDTSEPSDLTDQDGAYRLAGLPEGVYPIAEVIPDGWAQTTPRHFGDPIGVRITEIGFDAPDFIEIQNLAGQPIKTVDWQVVLGDTSNINEANSTTWSLDRAMQPSVVQYRTDAPDDNEWGSDIGWNRARPGWAMILDGAGDVVDWVGWGWSAAEIASFNLSAGGFSGITLGSEWSGASVPNDITGRDSIQRIGATDTNAAADFGWLHFDSKGEANLGLTGPAYSVEILPERTISGLDFGNVTNNLLQNGGGETPLSGFEIPFWNEVVGTSWSYRSASPGPLEGANYFRAGGSGIPPGGTAELSQDVDLSDFASTIDAGTQRFLFQGYARSRLTIPADRTRTIVEYRDSSGVLESFDPETFASLADWRLISDERLAPAGTQFARIRLLSTLGLGTTAEGYFDNLVFVASDVLGPIADVVASNTSVVVDELINFDASASVDGQPDGNVASYEWDFDYDGVTFDVDAVGPNVSHAYGSAALWTAAVRVTDDQFFPATDITTVSIDVQPSGTEIPGDMDFDGDVDFDDIDDFVQGLTDPAGYESLYGVPPETHGDLDGDGDHDFDDVAGFLTLLTGGLSAVDLETVEDDLTLSGPLVNQPAALPTYRRDISIDRAIVDTPPVSLPEAPIHLSSRPVGPRRSIESRAPMRFAHRHEPVEVDRTWPRLADRVFETRWN